MHVVHLGAASGSGIGLDLDRRGLDQSHYGGFGIGSASDATWQVITGVSYGLSDRWTLRLAYKALDFDREASGAELDMRMHGLVLGATYHFE